ncbi:DNA internalization-related competence protein ComEC/Rec2 [Limosilactobacillus caecicola]|uniref:DNA internalization-related competence protein ComEC/Rec2 n=1 Tax=Limosilactobacillus caecicola TaxID=2941332 RepID=UPI00203E2E76|nr:DNA internalization-related competence protein ComEC/Rec2 [Limosilactobacillus caecicola]
MIWLTIAIVGSIFAHCVFLNSEAKRYTIKREQTVQRLYRVEPDGIKTNGNLVSVIGRGEDQKRYLLSFQVTSRSELASFTDVQQPVWIRVEGKLSPLNPATNQNQFDAQRYYRYLRVYNCVRGTGELTSRSQPHGLEYLHCWRAQLSYRFSNLPAPINLFCKRLLLGISDQELGETIQNAQALGIIHLFCLSGLHVTVICQLMRRGLSLINLTREVINVVTITTLPLFWIIGGASGSLTRAILMTGVALLGEIIGSKIFDSWSWSLIIHLCFLPAVLLSLGGQLSYLLSFTLCKINWKTTWQQAVVLNVVSIPLLLNATYQVHLLTVILNYCMIPFFSKVILPLTIIAGSLGHCLPQVIAVVNRSLQEYQALISWLAKLPGLFVFGKLPNWLALGMIILTLLACDQWSWKKRLWRGLICVYLAAFCWIHFPLSGEVTFFDIGQGDSILLRTPFNRQVMLIDTGGRLQFPAPAWKKYHSNGDDAQRISVNYLKSKGINHLDAVLLSHSDADHIGYLQTICQQLKVKAVFVPSGMEKMTKFTKRIPNKIQIVPVTNQTDLSALQLQVLHPFSRGQGRNEDSMVLYGQFGGKTFIFSGDLDQAGELAVIKKYPQLTANVVKLGHHGSKTSSAIQYLNHLQPELAVISAGRQNRYGHPNQETIRKLKQQQIPFWSTQNRGMIQYQYYPNTGHFVTTLKGDEFNWMQ